MSIHSKIKWNKNNKNNKDYLINNRFLTKNK